MSMLEYFVRRVRESRGMEHQTTISALRRYINETPIAELLQAVNRMTEPEYFRTLWEAGLREPLRSEVLRRLEEITERRER